MPAQTVIKLRRDTAANWVTANSVLAAGETGLETDTNAFKFGDGTTGWNALPYGGADALPDQTGNAGKYLSTDGTDAAWEPVDLSGLVSKTNGTVTTASTSLTVVRNISISATEPVGGIDGDIWLMP